MHQLQLAIGSAFPECIIAHSESVNELTAESIFH
jgi:hypothetical protein